LADSKLEPIPTPVQLQLLRIRHQFMPALIFVLALCLTVVLWKNYSGTSNGTGEVSAINVRVFANHDGTLSQDAPFPHLYDRVNKGQPLGRLEGLQPVELLAPVTGTITAVHHQPGEFVSQGHEILTITEDTGAYIVSYIRPGSPIVPKKNMTLAVRGRDHRGWAECRIQEVGTRVVPIPEHQLANAKTPEWGIPIRIEMPSPGSLFLRPGELVLLNFMGGDAK
jgi:hypothetical protein